MQWGVWSVGILFFLSGGTALVYQVVWMRQLSLFFGSDAYAAAITLSVFMGGLSLGGYLVGRIGDRIKRPLLIYGLLEIGIALCALAFPLIIFGFDDVYRSIYQESYTTQPLKYQGFRIAVAIQVLLVPTALMGATLPLLIRQFAPKEGELGQWVSFFYATNTLGAFVGTLLAGFFLLQAFGVHDTNLANLFVTLAIGVVAVVLAGLGLGVDQEKRDAVMPDLTNNPANEKSFGGMDKKTVAVAIAISGLAALALEVVWTRVLVQSFSGTVHSFAVMLACFLFGIFYGSRKVAGTVDECPNPAALLYVLEMWLVGTVALLVPMIYIVPSFFGTLVWGLIDLTGGSFETGSIVAQFIIASLFIFGPATLLGATFPVAVKAYTGNIRQRAHGTGVVYAANTGGAMLGALFGGFVLLPILGTRAGLVAVAMLFLVAAMTLRRSAMNGKKDGRPAGFHTMIPLILLVGGTSSLALIPEQTVVNYNMQKSTTPRVIYHGDGVAHTVDIVRSDQGNIIMMVNGNIEADTTFVQRRHFVLKGHLPLLLHGQAREVAVVGLGLGITTRAILNNPTVDRVRLIELSPEIVEAHRLNPEIAGNVLEDPKLDLLIDDGRNFMNMTGEKFDMITADPIHPRITGVGYLYTQQYYEMIKRRLKDGGVVLQWMPMYRISKRSFDVALRTFAKVFSNASFWYVRGHGLFVGGTDALSIDYRRLTEQFSQTQVRKDLDSIQINTPEELFSHLLMDAEHVRTYLATTGDDTVNTDDNAFLEYNTPFEFLESPKAIVSGLIPHAGWNVDAILSGAPQSVRDHVRNLFTARLNRLLTELEEKIN